MSKCTTVNWQKSTKFHLQHEKKSNKTRCDVSVTQMFHTWMKTLLRGGYGKTQVNQMIYEAIQ